MWIDRFIWVPPTWVLAIIGVLWVCWAIFAIRFTNKVFKKLKYLLEADPNKMSQITCGARYDQVSLNIWEIYFGSVVFLPIKVVFLLVPFLVGSLIGKIICLIFKINDKEFYRPQSEFYFKLHYTIIGFLSRWCFLSFGWFRAPTRTLCLRDFWAGYKPIQDVSRTPLIISNHVSYLDMWVLLHLRENPGFLAKSGIQKMPFVGMFAKMHHCIFINRDDPVERERITQMIKDRIELVEKGQMKPLLIFPEGTTTNGRSLMKFKKGAFFAMKPFYVYGVVYAGDGSFSPCYDLIHPLFSLFLYLSRFTNTVEYLRFDEPIDPLWILQQKGLDPKVEENWEVVAEETKKLMCFAFGMKSDNSSFQEKKKFDIDMQGLTEEEFRKRGQ